ncbi:AzlD domain-containing protein [Alteromonadaceae bacterium BrNp21-10]|nr:AzlD domain-containing protein [Alteromonadaceae bacterium BrNp21-10]
MNEWWLIAGMVLVTFIPRYLPFALASRIRLPHALEQALNYVPIAVLTVIIVQTSLYADGKLFIAVSNPYIWGATAAFITAVIQPRLFISILMGLLTYAGAKIYLS